MTVLKIGATMLYCPKCQKTYEEGSRRFCSNDDEILLSASPSDLSANQTNGVFTNILNRKSQDEAGKFSSVSNSSQTESENHAGPNFRPPPSHIFRNKSELELELVPLTTTESAPPIIEQREQSATPRAVSINSESAPGERINSAEAETFNFDRPKDLLGKTIKNRYRVIEQIGADESGVVYRAEDKADSDEKVSLKILTNDDADDTFGDRILAEERISLARINHPNIVNVCDSGELPGGKPYIITEFTNGVTIKDYLETNEQFDALRVARIIRQSSDALEAAHRNKIPHRNLKPENIFLFVDESGVERVKLANFGAANEKLNEHNLLYKSPEQVAGKTPNFSSDVYSLAIIAYQMLTNRLPFNASSVGDLLKAQREGFQIRPSEARSDLPPSVDGILRKALAFNSFDRYSKARDFGDDFFSEIIADLPIEPADEIETNPNRLTKEKAVSSALLNTEKIAGDIYASEIQENNESESVKTAQDLAWEKYSPQGSNQPGVSRNSSSVVGIAILLAALLGVWYYFINSQNRTLVAPAPTKTADRNAAAIKNSPPAETNLAAAPTVAEAEARPAARAIQPPSDSIYFQNDKNNLEGDALENFLGFSLYYPKDWTRKAVKNNFLDVSKVTENNLPVEQMLVSYYSSDGTFNDDLKIFPALVKNTNATLEKIVPNYRMISEGATTVNNGWRAYEVKFQGAGKTAAGENITLWGKRLFIPTAIRGTKNGYVLTMLATSLSENVKNVDDVGVKGELSTVLETFEPL